MYFWDKLFCLSLEASQFVVVQLQHLPECLPLRVSPVQQPKRRQAMMSIGLSGVVLTSAWSRHKWLSCKIRHVFPVQRTTMSHWASSPSCGSTVATVRLCSCCIGHCSMLLPSKLSSDMQCFAYQKDLCCASLIRCTRLRCPADGSKSVLCGACMSDVRQATVAMGPAQRVMWCWQQLSSHGVGRWALAAPLTISQTCTLVSNCCSRCKVSLAKASGKPQVGF